MTGTVILVGADKGGVGKTMVARTLLDYIKSKGNEVRTFDAQYPAGDLVRFAEDATVIDIDNVQDQMKVFDGVVDNCITVIDLPAGLLSPTINALDEAKLLEDVRSGGMKMVLLHVLGPTIASLAEITSAAERIGGVKHILVKNHINQSKFFDWDHGASGEVMARMANIMVNVPQLAEIACEMMQKRGGSFTSFIAETSQSRILRGRVRTWLESVWKEFDRVNVLS